MLHRIISYLTLASFLFAQFFSFGIAYADDLPITPDGTTSTFVTQTASGIDQINIAAPNSSGLSHNKFTDYNVNTSGQILNNFSGSPTDVTATQIGGLVTANSNLSTSGSASIILNEVTSNNVSQLLGYTEIAGARADLIIANPNGITCAGCGFINVSRLGIIGGKSEFDASGNLGFELTETANTQLAIPIITISGLGLDASTTTSADIVASGVKLISSIYGGTDTDLTIQTGDGKYDYTSKSITSSTTYQAPSTTEPLFAIDASNLAKIQSGRIFLIATKEGLGVNMAAEILAGNSVQIDANGDVYYSNISAGESVDIKSSSHAELVEAASVIAPTITIEADELNNSGLLLANNQYLTVNSLANSGGIFSTALLDINLNGNDYNITEGELLANQLKITARNITNNINLYASDSLSLTASADITNYGEIASVGTQTLTANNLTNNSMITSGGDLDFIITNDLTNNRLSTILAMGDVSVKSSEAGDDGLYKINNFLNNSAHIESFAGNIAINAKDFTNKRDAQDLGIATVTKTEENKVWYEDEERFYEHGEYASDPIYRVNHGFSGIDFSKSTDLPYYENIAYTLYDGRGGASHYDSFIRKITQIKNQADENNKNSTIQAAGNLIINSDQLTNSNAEITAFNDINITTDTLNNKSTAIKSTFRHYCGAIDGVCILYKITYDESGNKIYTESGGFYTELGEYYEFESTSSFIPSLITAKNNLTITAPTKVDNGEDQGLETEDSALTNQSDFSTADAFTDDDLNDLITNGNLTDLTDLTNQLSDSLFAKNPTPSPLAPLYETRSQFLDQSQFKGSDYYFSIIGYDPDTVNHTILIGDNFFTYKLIEKQLAEINRASGNSFFSSSSNILIKELMDNALELKTDLALTSNITLSKDIVNNLKKSVVWFEEITLADGTKVLAPKVYLSQTDRATIASNQNTNTSGAIISAKNLSINSGDFNNSGLIIASNDLSITTSNNLTNSGILKAGNDLTLNTSYGDLISSPSLIKLAAISATNNLTLNSARNLTLSNTLLTSGNKLTLNSVGDINISNNRGSVSSIMLRQAQHDSKAVTQNDSEAVTLSLSKSGVSSSSVSSLSSISPTSSISSTSSTTTSDLKDNAATARSAAIFNAGTDIEINSGGSINIANNYSQAGGSIFLNAVGDINNSNYVIQADNNVVMTATNINNISTATTAAQATLNPTSIEAGAMVSLDAANNITNIGATIKGGDLVYLTAGNNIVNKALIEYNINGEKTYSSGLSSTQTASNFTTSTLDDTGTSTSDTNLLNSNANYIRSNLIAQGSIESEGNIVLVAGNNLNNIGSKITSTGSTLLEATNGDVNITTSILRDRTVESGGSRRRSWTRTTDTTTNLESEITSGGDLYLTSGANDINITGSSLTSTNNTEITAANDVNIYAAQNTSYNSFSSSKKGLTSQSTSSSVSGSVTNILSELTAGDDLSITSNTGNINLIGTKLTATNAALKSADEVNIYSVADTSYSYSQRSRSNGLGGLTSAILTPIGESLVQGLPVMGTLLTGDLSSSSAVAQNQKLTNQLANINVTGDLTLTSNNDMNLVGTSLSGDSASLTSTTGDINIANVKDSEYSYSDSKNSRVTASSIIAGEIQYAFALASSAVTFLNPTLLPDQKASKIKDNYDSVKELPQRQETHIRESQDETIIASTLNFNNLTLNSGSDTNITSSSLITNSGDLSINSSGSTNILTATENDFTNSFDSKKTPSIYAAIGNGITQTFNSAMPNFGHSGSDETSNNKLEELAYDTDSFRSSNSTSTNIASTLNSSGDLNITSTNNNLISGSSLDANNITITATNGTNIITSVADTSSTSTSSTSQDYANASLEYNRGRASANSNSEVAENTTTTTTTTQKQSELTAANNITITSKDDLSILSSNLTTDSGAISLTSSEGNVNILALANTTSTTSETKTGTQTLSAGIGNAHVDTAYAADDLVKAGKAFKDAKTDLNHMETLYKNGQADKEAVEDSKTNLAIAYLNFVLAEAKLAAAATKSAASAESLYTGFYADLRLSIEGTKTNSSINTSSAVTSNILSNGNLTISSGMSGLGLDNTGDTTITGSSLTSQTGDINITSRGDTVINASKDTYNSSTSTKSWSENLTLATTNAGGAGAMIDNAVNALQASLGLAMSKAKGDTSSTTYNNSILNANSGTIKINSLNNATIEGANLLAENIELNTVGDLTVESLQNSYKEKGSSFGMNLGIGGGSSKGSANGSIGINYSSNKTDRLWTDNQTSILGTNSVTINTGDNTNLKGALIANITNASSLRGAEGDAAIHFNSSAIDGGN
ncbi:MAG: hemagglutinin repeat-containing protein, partial [Proteobacteria bacterium]|nr:hemagglutinin repeat-containing protein [Pseudomonadota bacterium]